MEEHQTLGAFCPSYHYAVELIGRRWTGAIMRAMYCGEIRFSDITKTIPGLSDRLLSERLKELEHAGIVERTVFPETPVRIEYRLTEKGNALGEVMKAIATWSEEWVTPEELNTPECKEAVKQLEQEEKAVSAVS
jgi:DNA-binding HxlR family transcriptional regulator